MKQNNHNTLNAQVHMALTALSSLRYTHKKNQVLRNGSDLLILTTDQNETECLLAATRLDREAIHAKVISLDMTDTHDNDLLYDTRHSGMIFIVGVKNDALVEAVCEAYSGTSSPVCHSIQFKCNEKTNNPTELYKLRANEIYEQIVDAA